MHEEDDSISMDRRARRSLGGVALEVFSVVLGVLVALGVDGWNAEREAQARADRARGAILAKVRANKAELDNTLATLEAVVSRLSGRLGVLLDVHRSPSAAFGEILAAEGR